MRAAGFPAGSVNEIFGYGESRFRTNLLDLRGQSGAMFAKDVRSPGRIGTGGSSAWDGIRLPDGSLPGSLLPETATAVSR